MVKTANLAHGVHARKSRLLRTLWHTLCLSSLLLVPTAAITAPKAIPALPQSAPKFQPIRVETSQIKSFGGFGSSNQKVGKLLWLGGLELSSNEARFGGFSGLAFVDQQRFIAVGDKGTVFSARLVIENGRPVGLDETQFRFLPGLSERQREWRRDAEGIDIVGSDAYVSFEGDTRVMRYGMVQGEPKSVIGKLRLDKEVLKANQANAGLEAIAFAPKASPYSGAFILISEEARKGKVLGWIQRDRDAVAFTLPQQNGLYVTAAAFTASGDLLFLERKVSLLGGLVIQLRRVKAADFVAGDITRTDVLLRGTVLDGLDNMEGLAVQNLPDGSSLISLISDDNFNSFQSTILLQFLLPSGT